MFDVYTKESDTDILNTMKNNIDNTIYKDKGSFVYDTLSSTSQQIFENRIMLNDILNKAFVQTSYNNYLDMKGASRGVLRKQGKKSVGEITFTGEKGTKIGKGSLVQTIDGIQFETLEDADIKDTTIKVNIQAIDIGTKYNVSSKSINQIPITINGVFSVINEEPTIGGTDDETDCEYKKRILQRIQNPPSSGNKDDYERWSKKISGVEDTKVIPLWDGPGTVKIICYGKNGTSLDAKILQNVKNYIDPNNGDGEGTAPIGANVTVVTVTNKILNINIIGLDSSNLEFTKLNIGHNLKEYLQKIKPGETIKLIRVIGTIANTEGVNDFKKVLFNNTENNITTTNEEKIILGEIKYE